MASDTSFATKTYVCVTCFILDVCAYWAVETRFLAPIFMASHYKYITGNEHAEPSSVLFWLNIFTFYNLILFVARALAERPELERLVRGWGLRLRFTLSIVLILAELALIFFLPVLSMSPPYAIVSLCFTTILGTIGKQFLGRTTHTLWDFLLTEKAGGVMRFTAFLVAIVHAALCIIVVVPGTTGESRENTLSLHTVVYAVVLVIALVMVLSLSLIRCTREGFRSAQRAAQKGRVEGINHLIERVGKTRKTLESIRVRLHAQSDPILRNEVQKEHQQAKRETVEAQEDIRRRLKDEASISALSRLAEFEAEWARPLPPEASSDGGNRDVAQSPQAPDVV
ncbi:unnamed protein product [Trypanosoma congolense IL3000]|uniref:WGS project CAEQ00000000 data, annotated contig 481 n=1 Tax=Trypanosoma congolense (strain IL3000) TaxID=1068625 RepID=F9WGA1_TRYCI|nr:unnamed protein product [Trypanosoma congolense IL3000]